MKGSIAETIVGTLVTLGVAALIVWVGWKEPLRYRFMSQAQIDEEQFALIPQTQVESNQWSPRGTALDRAPYRRTKDGVLRYSRTHDARETGVPTESGIRPNTRGGEGNPLPSLLP